MDLQDFRSEALYFDEPVMIEVTRLMAKASEAYDGGQAEAPLLEALLLAPESLSVLVGLYRFYFYQHRYEDALTVAQRLMTLIAPRIEFPGHWTEVGQHALERGILCSLSLVRFYLLALKAAGYINLRLARFEEGKHMLTKVASLDEADRLGARVLLDVLADNQAEIVPFPIAARKLRG